MERALQLTMLGAAMAAFGWLFVQIGKDNEKEVAAMRAFCQARLADARTAADTVAVLRDGTDRWRCEFALIPEAK